MRKVVQCAFAFVVFSASMSAQSDSVVKSVELAVAAKESGDLELAGRHLFDAVRALELVGDAEAGGLRARIDAANEHVDKTLRERVELDHDFLEQAQAIARKMIDAGFPATSKAVCRQIESVDPESGKSLTDMATAADEARSKGESKRDRSLVVAFQLLRATDPSSDLYKETAARLESTLPLLGDWNDVRARFARKYQSLARSYFSRKWIATAMSLTERARGLDGAEIDSKFYSKVASAQAKLAQKDRELRAVPTMEAFRQGHEKFGKSKAWKLSGKIWRTPKPSKRDALVLSTSRLTGDYEIEVEQKLVDVYGKFELVFAARSEAEYLALGFDRSKLRTTISVVHVRGGVRRPLVGIPVKNTVRAFSLLKVRVEGSAATISMGRAERTATIPFAKDGGLRFGFALPPQEPQKSGKRGRKTASRVEMRNLIVTEK